MPLFSRRPDSGLLPLDLGSGEDLGESHHCINQDLPFFLLLNLVRENGEER